MVRLVIGILAVLLDAVQMFREYKKRNITGVLFWGILLLGVVISMN